MLGNLKSGIFLIILFQSLYGFTQTSFEKIHAKTDKLAAKFIIDEQVPGLSLSISVNDTIIYSRGFGYSDIEQKTPVSPSHTRFRIASITKSITASTLSRLAELRQVDLKQSVYFYLDSLPKKTHDFSVEEVGAHIAGLQRIPSTERYSCDNSYDRGDFYKIFAIDTLLFKPSTNFEYSNYGYKLLGLVIEKCTGNSLFENHKKYIIDVIGMKNTVPETREVDSLKAKFYIKQGSQLIEAKCLDCTFKYAGGCYLSTSEDLIMLGNAFLFPDRILSKESLVAMIKPKRLSNGLRTNYGFGFGSGTDSNLNYFYGHDGGYESARSSLRIYPNSKIVISALANCAVENIDTFVTKVVNNYIRQMQKI